LTRRQTLEILQAEKKPLLQPTDEEQSLLRPQVSRKSSIRKDPSKVGGHEVHIPGQCTLGQAVLNGKYTHNCYSEAILSEE